MNTCISIQNTFWKTLYLGVGKKSVRQRKNREFINTCNNRTATVSVNHFDCPLLPLRISPLYTLTRVVEIKWVNIYGNSLKSVKSYLECRLLREFLISFLIPRRKSWNISCLANPKKNAPHCIAYIESDLSSLPNWCMFRPGKGCVPFIKCHWGEHPLLNTPLSLHTAERSQTQALHLEISEEHVPFVCHLFSKALLKSLLMSFLEKMWRNSNATNHFLPSHWTSY